MLGSTKVYHMEERRKYKRFDLALEVKYKITGWGERYSTVSKNISAGGICLTLDSELKEKTLLEIELPPAEKGSPEPINVRGEIVWLKEVGSTARQAVSFQKESSLPPWRSPFAAPVETDAAFPRRRFEAGVKFIGINQDMTMKLLKFISSRVSKHI